jgi:hypothetical protein
MINTKALLSLWKVDQIPACDEGMELAREFLIACVRGVDRISVEDTLALRSDFIFRYSRFALHRETCPKCNEVRDDEDR